MTDPNPVPTLHLICGKIASGKSTLSARLANAPRTVLIAEDEWLSALFGDQMQTLKDYARFSARLRAVMAPHIEGLLTAEVSVVLDFAANTVETRQWMRDIIAQTGVAHALHYLDASDALCLERLRARNKSGTHPFTVSDEQFQKVTAHFVAPLPEEGFNIVRHAPA